MTTKHTPGPWTCNANYSTQHYMVWDADGNYHQMRDEVAEMDANARLIAAAPDLLLFSRDIVAAIKNEFSSSHALMEYAARLEDAIARATGAAP